MVRLPVGVRAPPGAAFFCRIGSERSNFGARGLQTLFRRAKNSRHSRPMQARRLADLADRQACLPCSLEAFASCLARFLLLPPDALKRRLSALHISARFLLFALGHEVETIRRVLGRSPRERPVP